MSNVSDVFYNCFIFYNVFNHLNQVMRFSPNKEYVVGYKLASQ